MFITTAVKNFRPNLRLLQSASRHSSAMVYEPPKFDELNSETWIKLNKDTKEEIQEYLDWKMEDRWSNMSPREQRAIYFISYGEWGPRAKSGSKEAQMQMSGAEIILRGIFSGVLFTAVAVSIMNYQSDRKMKENLNKLEEGI
ncbi:LANO_0D01288g1_1 [Lachancea nothofagi CBS 11611]|uniref:LANO_0D01288g1_1 n=1 Tax=Lachancea nothofagi CBS 11611 TaxID=1266666 RepID=A0A1G4JD98_9SACH|nr:LANO_0D01288g1_1 [Lachancea nothofagi CBS 11611]